MCESTKIGNYFVSLPQSYSISPMKIHLIEIDSTHYGNKK